MSKMPSVKFCLLVSVFLGLSLYTSAEVKVTLLGTGGPEITADRSGIATLIEVDDELLLFDTGRGVLQRLYETQTDPTRIQRIFFTHLHNDHIEGLPNLWITPWFLLGREHGFELWGPEGLQRTIDGMRAMYHFDLSHRVNAFNDIANLDCIVHEIASDPLILNTEKFQISAIPVEHGDGNPAFGFVITGSDWKIALSGDCTYTPAFSKAAKGADILVHNVIALSPPLAAKPEMKGVLAKLATPANVARIMTETQPRLGVLSHIVKKELPGDAGDQFIIDSIREEGYQGPLEMGADRTVLILGKEIEIVPPGPTDELPDLDKKSSYEPEI